MSTDPCMDAAIAHVRKVAPGHARRDDRLFLSLDDHYRLTADLRKKAERWEAIAKDLAETSSAIVLSINAKQPVPPMVMGLWQEAAGAYDQATNEDQSEIETSKNLEP